MASSGRHAGAKLSKLLAAFNAADTNGSGSIDKAELGKIVRQCNLGCSKAELLNMFECLDLSEDGEVSLVRAGFGQLCLSRVHEVLPAKVSTFSCTNRFVCRVFRLPPIAALSLSLLLL